MLEEGRQKRPVMVWIYGGGFGIGMTSEPGNVPFMARPLVAIGLAAFILTIGLTGFLGNQFAFDRS
jgi:carboxylesterase type B